MKPLKNIRVLDLTNVLAGPFCCHQLAHLGAEVIKVEERTRGDLARQLGADPDLNEKLMGISFLAQNAGKKSITLNLKKDQGKELLKQLVAKADVLVENFRPGVMDGLELGWDVLKEVNTNLIYCAISGFGQDGPWVQRPAYDQIIQGASGIMSITGDAESAPLRVGYPIADTVGGITAAFAISAALNGRDRNGGSFIDVSMLEATLATMGWAISNWLIGGVHPHPQGNENGTSSPSGTFATADNPINIAANKQEQWLELVKLLQLEHLASDPNYMTREKRIKNRIALKKELEKSLKTRPAKEWEHELNRVNVPCGAVLNVPDILAAPQISERGMLADFDDVPGVDRSIRVVRTGIKYDGEAPSVAAPPPELGQHNNEVFESLGLSQQEIASLRKGEVI